MRFKTLLCLTLLSGSGCAVNTTTPDFCNAYLPVPTLSCGSDLQQLRTDQNNAVYDGLCSSH
ncbi:MAG: hypothetical protein VXY16_01650 [Pseudomonadota bacterium]|nr:hypothetical protein [Pseudomonadota bacterium]